MVRRLSIVIALLVSVAAGLFADRTAAAPDAAQACNLRGSWTANNAETNQYFRAINPTTGDISVVSGALTATFTRRQWTFGGIGLKLVGHKGRTTIKEEIDLESTAPYTVHGSTIHLGAGSYKLIHISTVLISNGKSKSIRLPNTSIATPGNDVGYNCTPRVLHLQVAAGASTVTLTLARSR
jgi:hypothetical protein